MKTTYLDNEIILLERYKKEGTASFYQSRKLAEYLKIKQLITGNVVGQSEQLLAFAKHLLPKEDVSLLMNEVSVFISESK